LPKPTSSVPSLSRQGQKPTSFLYQSVPVRPKLTSSLPSHSSHAKTDFLNPEPFQLGQNWLPLFKVNPVRPSLWINPPFTSCLFTSGHWATQFLFLLQYLQN
jgi:hypothetical protein